MNSKSTKSKSTKLKSLQKDDIIQLILRDHKPLKASISVLKNPKLGMEDKKAPFEEFVLSLGRHAKAEEESLYIHLKEEDDLRMDGLEGDTEHAIADRLITEIKSISHDDDQWMAKVKVLAELVEHHIKEEETDMLKQVKAQFDSAERLQIGQEYTYLLGEVEDERDDDRAA